MNRGEKDWGAVSGGRSVRGAQRQGGAASGERSVRGTQAKQNVPVKEDLLGPQASCYNTTLRAVC